MTALESSNASEALGDIQIDWKSTRKINKRYEKKFCDKWLKLFKPWLSRSPNDPEKPYCRVCQTKLNSNRNHLARHATATKHKRNMSNVLVNGEVIAETHSYSVVERKPYVRRAKPVIKIQPVETEPELMQTEQVVAERQEQKHKPTLNSTVNEEYSHLIEEVIESADTGKDSPVSVKKPDVTIKLTTETISAPRDATKSIKESLQNAEELRKQCIMLATDVEKYKAQLSETFKDIMNAKAAQLNNRSSHSSFDKYGPMQHVDLFFESVCSTVKTLSPKLVAEAKMRFSSILGELELRHLTETSSANDGNMLGVSAVVFSNCNSDSYIVNSNRGNDGISIQEM